jgi:urease accessory protein
VKSFARLAVERVAARNGSDRSIISRQQSQQALVLRRVVDQVPAWAATHWGLDRENTTAVRLVAGAAGPVGGDCWRFDVDVGVNAALMLGAAAGTVALPGPHGCASTSEVNVTVGANATLIWDPGTQIAAAGCRHQTVNRIELASGARLFIREIAVLGRHGELPGHFGQRLRVVRAGSPLYDQEISVGDDGSGWNGPAVVGGRRAMGSLLVVDPTGGLARTNHAITAGVPDTAIMQLADDAALITSLDGDAVGLRTKLSAAFESLPTVQGGSSQAAHASSGPPDTHAADNTAPRRTNAQNSRALHYTIKTMHH